MIGAMARSCFVIASVLAGMPEVADAGGPAKALEASQAAWDAFSQLLDKAPEDDLPKMSDPGVAKVLAAVWNPDFLQTPGFVGAEYLRDLDKICLNGMVVWKSYLFERTGGLEDLDTKMFKRMTRYQMEFGSEVAFSLRCAATFIDAFEAAAPETSIEQKGAYRQWIDRETGWIVSSFGIVCSGLLAADSSRLLSDALHTVLPGLLTPGRRTLDRAAFLESAHHIIAEAAVAPGDRNPKGCSDLEALLTPQTESGDFPSRCESRHTEIRSHHKRVTMPSNTESAEISGRS